MDRGQKIIIFLLSGLLVAALVVLGIVLATRGPEVVIADFVPPEFDENAVSGVPDNVPQELNYGSPISQNEFLFALCGTPSLTDENSLHIYFTSHEENQVWLLIRIYTADGVLIGESGLLRPGEYVEYVELSERVSGRLKLRILSYEPDTYYSKGAVSGEIAVLEE